MIKYFASLALLLAASLGAAAQEKVIIDSSYNNGHYRNRLEYFRLMPDQKKEIVFVGNSITEMGEWQELLPGRPVVNRGISGDVTYGVLARIDEVLSSKPAKIFILSGVNDLKRGIPVDTVAKTFERILMKMKAGSPKTKVYVESILPVNEIMLAAQYKKVTNELIAQLNHRFKSLAEKFGYTWVDIAPAVADENGQLKKENTQDGLHLWPAAYIRWVALLKEKGLLK